MVFTKWMAQLFGSHRLSTVFSLCVGLGIYSYWFYGFSLLIFGFQAGIPMCLFFVPLFNCSFPYLPLSLIGVSGMLVIFLFFQGLISVLILYEKYTQLLMFGVLFLIIVYFPCPIEKKPKWLDNIAALNILFMAGTDDPWQRADDILNQLESIKQKNEEILLIIAPESTFTWPLNKFKSFINKWSIGLDEKTTFIIGTQRIVNEKLYNSAYFLKQSRITQIYDKRIPLIFTERQPDYCNFTQLCSFFTTKNETCQGESTSSPFYIENSTIPPLTPLICSEFFFAYQKPVACTVAVCLINDSWFSTSASWHVLLALARLNALAWTIDVLYISHHFQLFITSRGQIYELNRSPFQVDCSFLG